MKNWSFFLALSLAMQALSGCASHQAGKPGVPPPTSCACPCRTAGAQATAATLDPNAAPIVAPEGLARERGEKGEEEEAGDADHAPRYEIPLVGPSQGAANARVNIVEFSDFQCPFCARGADIIRQVLEAYPKDVRLYFRHFPLPFHVNASLAAQATMAAEAQGKFWQMHDKLFANQQLLKRADMEAYARDIGLDVDRFKKDLDAQTFGGKVAADAAFASHLGVRGTPSFFINGRFLPGAQPLQTFKALIDDELRRAQKSEGTALRHFGAPMPVLGRAATDHIEEQ